MRPHLYPDSTAPFRTAASPLETYCPHPPCQSADQPSRMEMSKIETTRMRGAEAAEMPKYKESDKCASERSLNRKSFQPRILLLLSEPDGLQNRARVPTKQRGRAPARPRVVGPGCLYCSEYTV